ncbi:MAG TPA: type II toxin-antitoxin system VapC family toxin [Burkholderiales bacterium]|nr:type II toxin-antitoxin system VapC family toxin [Burkholderiales bacterium]
MRILLDTHLLLWAMAASRKLPRAVRAQLLDPGNEIYYSAASLWEIAIKSGLRRKDFRIDIEALLAALRESGFVELPITALHAAGVAKLPPVHKDPFDRLLVAQSMAEPMTLLTNDATLGDYWDGVKVV